MKKNIKKFIVIGLILILIISIIFYFIFLRDRKIKESFVLDSIYDVYPEEVRSLYANMVNVSCNGDIHFDIDIDTGEVMLNKINHNNLLDYMFSYMDKNNLLTDEISDSTINEIEKDIFGGNIDLLDDIKNYQYNDYFYNYSLNKITRKSNKCNTSDKKNVLYLYGYFHDEYKLSLDINVTYLKNGILYDLDDNVLGEYDGNSNKLMNLTEYASYYRVSYVKENGKYKLNSVELKHRD